MLNTKEGGRQKAEGGRRKAVSRFGFRLLPAAFCLLLTAFCFSGCRQDMHDQPKIKPLRPSSFFADGRGARPLPDGTVARGQLRDDVQFYSGKMGQGAQTAAGQGAGAGQNSTAVQSPTASQQGVAATPSQSASVTAQYQGFATTFPFPIDEAALDRGEERFNIYCSVCHGRTGDGLGMIVRRGYRKPPSFHEDRLRQAPAGYIFDVMTNGFGAMPDYSAQISVEDRWKIIAYIRALQLSQNASLADVPPDKRDKVGAAEQQGEQKRGEHNQ
ncbi:MAG TPA: cytochrome c [Blastocatellia bacterium]|nr:cytochrome c [Blastocatellia bacterium]